MDISSGCRYQPDNPDRPQVPIYKRMVRSDHLHGRYARVLITLLYHHTEVVLSIHGPHRQGFVVFVGR